MYNQNRYITDSTYGSLSGFLSSNSSYTMSLSDSEFPEEPPSTSGCSSDFANSTHQKEKKKERLKQYLKQLKQMVAPESNIGGQLSTIGALKHVLDSMQKNKDGSQTKGEEGELRQYGVCTSISGTSESEDDMKVLSLKSQDDLQILVSTKGLKIIQISPSLKKILGYPMDSWTGRDLASFLHRKDVVTVNSSFTSDDYDRFDSHSLKYDEEGTCNSSSENPKKVIYCRLRHYKSLRKGFNIDKRDQYSSFQATVTLKTSPKVNKSDSMIDRQKQYLLYECRPLTSAYKNWSDIPADKKVFSTRHSLFCSYTYIHPNAIQLLGFLPQDMIGMSIFDFYHPEDFEQLYAIYKQVVSSKGSTISSPRIRLRTYNGDWIFVKTEWSRFINPWSKRLEFIIGQHTVVRGPKNIDVFSPPNSQECIAEESDQYNKNLRMIRKLLLQPVVEEARTVALNFVEDEPSENVSVSPKYEDKEEGTDTAEDSKKKFQQSVAGDIRCRQLLDENPYGTYEQLNYTNNIKRFLLSQPKTYSSASDKRSGSCTDDSNAVDSDEVPDFEVDIPLPKPPSFCSSTKVLVSEKEDMVPSPSYQPDEIVEETTSREPQNVVQSQEAHNVLMSLTQETLQEHTKQQEQIYLQQAKQDKNLVLLNVTSKYSVMQESSHGLKRVHSPDMDEIQNIKSFKAEEISLLHPPFPISTVGHETDNSRVEPANIAFSDMYRLNNSTMYHTSGMPVVQMVRNTMMYPTPAVNSMSSSGMKPENVQWPFYPQSGLSFYPQVMGGFYQPMTVLSYTVPGMVWPSVDSKASKPTKSQGIFTQAGGKGQTSMSISDTSSQENTSSSLMYLLELSNNSEVDGSKNKKKLPEMMRLGQRNADPLWLFGALWNENIQMRYTVPRRKFNRVMKEDRASLNSMKQSDMMLMQMKQFKENLEEYEEEPNVDEEVDYLFMIEPDIFKDDSPSDYRESEDLKIKLEFPSVMVSNISDDSSSKSSCQNKLESDDGLLSGGQDSSFSNDQMDEREKKSSSDCDSLQKSSDTDSSADIESTCSKSSDLTPSDARSTDEKGSSMKESDSLSSKLSEGNKDSESENDLGQTKIQEEKFDSKNFDSFFIKNPTKFKHSKKGFWMNETNLNERVQNKYTMRYNNQNDILLDDLQRLNEMNQSPVVHDQLSTLLDDLKQINSSQREQCSCCRPLGQTNADGKFTRCQKISQKELNNEINTSFFESLFMRPLYAGDNMSSEYSSSRDSPDMEDLCDIIDPLD